MRLRVKLMLALLCTGLAAVAMVGGLAFFSLNSQVDAIRKEQAAGRFHRAMTAYLARYGDWQTAVASESFESFTRNANASGVLPSEDRPDNPPRQEGLGDWPPPPRGNRPPEGPPGFAPPPGRAGPPPGHTGPPHGESPRGRGEPPFRFILADADYRVLLGGGQFQPGEQLPHALRTSARPIVVDGREVAYMSSEGVPTATPQEQQYLDAMKSSLRAGVAAAAVLAVGLGLLLSRGLSGSVGKLTQAVRAMHKGELRQQVPVNGRDEVAELAAAFNEMSEQLAHQAEQLRELSIRDALTQLYNRRHYDEQALSLYNQAVRHRRPLALAICDIDHFKRINDKFSHATGDQVLRQVADLLRGHMRQSDLAARYGGEEFVLAFPETAGVQAAALCDKLRSVIEAYDWTAIHPDLQVTMSTGVCDDMSQRSAEAMLQKADVQLYRAKESGRNRVCFN
jgi:diguanylate cyclase (GGDEF)-like protein